MLFRGCFNHFVSLKAECDGKGRRSLFVGLISGLFLAFGRGLWANRFRLYTEAPARGSRLGQLRWKKESGLALDAATGQKSEDPCQTVQQAFMT